MDIPRASTPQKHKHKKKKHKHKPIKSDPLDMGREYSTLVTPTLPGTPTYLNKTQPFETPAGEPSSSTSVHSVGGKDGPVSGKRYRNVLGLEFADKLKALCNVGQKTFSHHGTEKSGCNQSFCAYSTNTDPEG